MNGYGGMCMNRGKFLMNDKWQIKLLNELFSNSHSTFYEWFKQEIMTFRVSKFTNGYEGMCMNRGKFLKEWQVTDKIIEWIVFQFTFNHSQMDMRGCVWVGKVSYGMTSDR